MVPFFTDTTVYNDSKKCSPRAPSWTLLNNSKHELISRRSSTALSRNKRKTLASDTFYKFDIHQWRPAARSELLALSLVETVDRGLVIFNEEEVKPPFLLIPPYARVVLNIFFVFGLTKWTTTVIE